MSFTVSSQYLELFIVATGFFCLGWRRHWDPFKVALLVLASVAAFRTSRDGWFVCIASLVIIAENLKSEEHHSPADARPVYRPAHFAPATIIAALALWIAAPNLDFTPRGLDRAVSGQYPVDAANFIRRNRLPGPLYNSFDWGGFLIWYMPQYPVAIDGRNDLYGDKLVRLFFDTQDAVIPYAENPYFRRASLVLLQAEAPLAKLLSVDPEYRLVYEDEMAVAFLRQ